MQGVAHHHLCEELFGVSGEDALQEDASIAAVLDDPVERGGEEGEGELSGAGYRRRVVRRNGGVEVFANVEEAEEGRSVELAVLPEEGTVGHDAAEGDAGGVSADQVS